MNTQQKQLTNENYWKNRKVLVTGAGGFIASHLVEKLVDQGAIVRAFVRYNSRNDPGLLRMLPEEKFGRLEIISGDLRDLDAVKNAMRDIQTVFHLGALIAIPYSYRHPAEVVETNVIGTLNVLLSGKETLQSLERIIHTSTSEVYGTAQRVPIDEEHPLQGQSPYSASKIGADKLAESFFLAYDMPVVTLRPFNTYGPRQSTRAVIPTIIAQALTQDVVRLGNLDAKRDLTYVSDTVNGFMLAGEVPGILGQTINLGTGREVTIRELADEIIRQINQLYSHYEPLHPPSLVSRDTPPKERGKVRIEVENERLRPKKSEVQRLLSDNRRARELLGWQPRIELEQGLSRTIAWIQNNLTLYDPHSYQV